MYPLLSQANALGLPKHTQLSAPFCMFCGQLQIRLLFAGLYNSRFEKFPRLDCAPLDTAAKNGSETLPEPAGGTPALRSAAVPAAGSRGFPAPCSLWRLLHLVTVSCARVDLGAKIGPGRRLCFGYDLSDFTKQREKEDEYGNFKGWQNHLGLRLGQLPPVAPPTSRPSNRQDMRNIKVDVEVLWSFK